MEVVDFRTLISEKLPKRTEDPFYFKGGISGDGRFWFLPIVELATLRILARNKVLQNGVKGKPIINLDIER